MFNLLEESAMTAFSKE